MNSAENSKLSRVISTKVTHEEANFLMRIAEQYKSQGYIPKATPSEICRFILRVYMQYLISHKTDPMASDIKTVQSPAGMQTNPPMIAFKEISPSSRHRTEDISQRVSHGDSISRNNISSMEVPSSQILCMVTISMWLKKYQLDRTIQEIRRETHPAV